MALRPKPRRIKDQYGVYFAPDIQVFRFNGRYFSLNRHDHEKCNWNKAGVVITRENGTAIHPEYSTSTDKEVFELANVYYELGMSETMTFDAYISYVKSEQ